MSSSGRRRFSMKHPAVVVDVGCSCRRSKLVSLISSFIPKPRRFPNPPLSSASSSAATASLWTSVATTTTMTQSSSASHAEIPPSPRPASKPARRRRRSKRTRNPAAESVPVVKESSEPYSDFRDSMVQMIVENELYAWDDLNDLLHRFLSLNSPRHHHLILHAFADLWNGVFSPPSPCQWDNY